MDMLCVEPFFAALIKFVAIVSCVNLTFITVFIQFGSTFNEKIFLYITSQKSFSLNVYLRGPSYYVNSPKDS